MSVKLIVRTTEEVAEQIFEVIHRRPENIEVNSIGGLKFDMEFTSEELMLIKLVIPNLVYDFPLEILDE